MRTWFRLRACGLFGDCQSPAWTWAKVVEGAFGIGGACRRRNVAVVANSEQEGLSPSHLRRIPEAVLSGSRHITRYPSHEYYSQK